MVDAAYAIRHNLWATGRLLEHARTLTPDQLELTVAGTAGSVRFCLAHIVGADQRYLEGLGQALTETFREGPDSDLERVERIHAANVEAWERVFAETPDLDGWYERPGGRGRVRPLVLPAQAVHHGTDHRTQIGTILLHHGLELPSLDVWAYAMSCGDFEPPKEFRR